MNIDTTVFKIILHNISTNKDYNIYYNYSSSLSLTHRKFVTTNLRYKHRLIQIQNTEAYSFIPPN